MPLVETRGAASAQGFGFLSGQATAGLYIEDVYSTFLYTGNGSTQTITNGIDLATHGGLVWIKERAAATTAHALFGSLGTISNFLSTDSTFGINSPGSVTAFDSNGFSLGSSGNQNRSGQSTVAWTFRKAPKFFDVVTYTGNGANRTIAHNLGSVPGCIIVKRTDTAADWQVYHRSLANTDYLVLNSTAASATGTTRWNSTTPTSTVFSLGTDTTVNASGGTYVAYLFAHDASGFGASGTDNVISCGSFTTDGSGNASVTLGYEPQWVMYKRSSGTSDWKIVDVMRGYIDKNNVSGSNGLASVLYPNLSSAELTGSGSSGWPTATGFGIGQESTSSTFIYIAIRRGPMRTPTSGTSVFAPSARSGTGAAGSSTALGNVTDLAIIKQRGSTQTWAWTDRLRGATNELTSAATTAETAYSNDVTGFDSMTGFLFGSGASGQVNSSGSTYIDYLLRRAPGVHEQICYTGTGSNKTETHNLGKAPELWMVKARSAATEWVIGSSLLSATEKIVMPSPNGRVTDTTVWNSTLPTSSVLSLGTSSTTNSSGVTFVAYMWATTAGVSKVGTYTGNGTSQTIDCGFTSGARFVMIIRATASTSQDIYIWDSARGIVAGNDPRLSLNTTAAEVTTLDTVDTDSTGFVVNTDASNVNVSSAVYLYLAIA